MCLLLCGIPPDIAALSVQAGFSPEGRALPLVLNTIGSAKSSPDIEWLLKQGRQPGVSAKLASKLNYLWCSCTGELSEQNDLFRLMYTEK